ncbi:malonic semialdehyde reductase [Actimicrobium sp. CCI2.3]|uniref:malonic semialdehyde reductase n=1 Tax=Actimicrobium sp. CCI2.3 TaxID=3048616 RepID=UPI002AB3E579|nr:malonic semialdehyde reductase [Actimicrobium sp. CCI2.3]MDY7575676.1 malonic semialdehyde reductase [Actimicrobium sp. CCI2.3]MEB0021953.1 malonic semialdehyde reductase [Actimicrobium sp. CCI2.3]
MLDQAALATLFSDARSHNGWLDQPVSQTQLQQLYDLVKWAPTSANCEPARIVFVQSDDARAKLADCMAAGNAEKVRTAPVTAIIGMDMAFLDKLPHLFPHADARSWFAGNQPLIDATAFRNSSLQGGYFMLAARALGLDVGPMSGFDAGKVDAAFFGGTTVKVNFVCSIGHGDATKLFARSPRLSFEEACSVI